MEQQAEMIVERVVEEIAPKKKGYVVIRRCPPEALAATVDREAAALFSLGAEHVYAASTEPDAPLEAGRMGNWDLRYVHDMLGMERGLGADRPRPLGRLTLEPLTRERGTEWLRIYNESFFDVPNSATYGEKALEQVLTDQYSCGFAMLDGARVGIYECGFKKKFPEIGSVGLDAAFRGRGLGRELLLTVMDHLAGLGHDACWLQVSTANGPAYALYQSVGFTLDRVLSRWFEVTSCG